MMKLITIFIFGFSVLLSNCSNVENSGDKSDATNVKLKIFNDVELTKSALSKNGIGELQKWHSNEMGGFISISNYFVFGSASESNGLENNLAYYLESDNENYIKRVQVVLNLNNKNERAIAIARYRKVINSTLSSLEIGVPEGLIDSIFMKKEFNDENEIFSTELKLEIGKVETYILTIETK